MGSTLRFYGSEKRAVKHPYRRSVIQKDAIQARPAIFQTVSLRTPVNRDKRKGDENSRPSVGLHTFADQFMRIIEALPTTDLRLLVAFEALVDLKELLDLAQVLLRQILQG